jgi:PAS domain S-box-containing protein
MDERSAEPRGSLGEQVLESVDHGVLLVDRRGRVLLANRAARAILGAGVAQGADLGRVLAGAPELAEAVAAAIEQPGRREWTEVRVTLGGAPRVLGVRGTPLAAAGPGALVLTLTDVTEARAAEAAARHDAILAGLGRWSHHVAHELKNPLGALKLYALLLERQLGEAKPDGLELMEKITRSVNHLAQLVSEMSAVGTRGPIEAAPLPLAAVVDECLGAVEDLAGSIGVEVVRRYEEGLTVPADGRALRQALLAVIRNALDAMPSGGTLTVGCARSTCGTTRGAEVTVRDTGTGMSHEVQARLYEPFFTTKADGTGLGMTIASQVVGQHGGRIELCSRPGEGTMVRVVLPAA